MNMQLPCSELSAKKKRMSTTIKSDFGKRHKYSIPAVNTLQIQDSDPGSFDASSDTAVSLELLLPLDIGNRIPCDK